jgi:prephenate dehydrogenase
MKAAGGAIGIVGLGLMGGAIARALRPAAGERRILACDTNKETLAHALNTNLIDESFADSAPMLKLCELVFLCLNPSTLIRFMESYMGDFKEGALITDIAGTKKTICAVMEKTLRPDLDFIPGHPMAGAEKGGFANYGLCDFKGKNYILTPLGRNKPENLEFLKGLIRQMGFGQIIITSPEDHDARIAFTSQLCHVIASALIDCEPDPGIIRFGGGSFEDLTRIAMLNVPMWTELFIENRAELLKRIEQFEGSLGILKSLIKREASGELARRLNAVRDRRMGM